MKRAAGILLAVLVLAGCSARPAPVEPPVAAPTAEPTKTATATPSAPAADGGIYVASIADLWGDCIATLGVTGLTYAPASDTSGPIGYVTGTDPATTLTWSIAIGNTGNILNSPADDQTVAELATVGC